MLAQQLSTPTAGEFGAWITAGAAALGLIYLVLSVYQKIRQLQRPAEKPGRYVSRREFRRAERDNELRFSEITQNLNSMGVRIEQVKLEIFREIQTQGATLEGKIDDARQQLARLAALIESSGHPRE